MDRLGKNPGLSGDLKGGGAICIMAGDTEVETAGIHVDHTVVRGGI